MGINDNQSIGSRLDWVNYMVALSRKIDKISRTDYKLNITQSRILIHMALHGTEPIGNIASTLYLKASTITAAMDILENKGFVKRSSDDEDKRHVCVEITDAGREVAPHYVFIIQEVFDELDNQFNPNTLDDFFKNHVKYFNKGNISFEHYDVKEQVKLISSNIETGLGEEALSKYVLRAFVVEVISGFLANASIHDRKAHLSINEGRIMRTLGCSKKGLRLSVISDSISIRPNVATVSVTALVEKGFVKRETDPYDRRAACVSLTREGKKLLSTNNVSYCKMFDSYFPTLAKAELADFIS